ncbi:hypothetical protein ACFVH4_22570 [Nocardia ignorata]|uniref:hypothetical protein n=1 Tax=Nocardia ignorata TaxID=145285 RepID=UPI0036261169
MPAVVTADVESAHSEALRHFAFYEQIPSYRRVLDLERVARAAELALIGDEETVAAGIGRYFDAGATEVVLTATDLTGPADHRPSGRTGQTGLRCHQNVMSEAASPG